jgi:hypothetical protein
VALEIVGVELDEARCEEVARALYHGAAPDRPVDRRDAVALDRQAALDDRVLEDEAAPTKVRRD